MRLLIEALFVVLLMVPWTSVSAVSVAMPIPVDVQIALFVNVWKLDRNFDHGKPVTLAVLYQQNYSESVSAKDDLVAAIGRQKLRIVAIPIEAGTQELMENRLRETPADVVYVTPLRAVNIDAIWKISRYRRLRTVTGVPEYIDAGLAVGIGIRRNRPLIIVNLAQSRAEGSSFSSQLLALARIVGPLR
jgi:hypothetical protein